MTRYEIVQGLKFTIDMFLLNPNTGEEYTEPINDMDKTTIDACKGAIELLEEPRKDEVILTKKEYGELVSSEFDNGYAKGYREALEQQKKGKWRKNEHTFWTCSECGLVNKYNRVQYAYCPNCGAKMESEDK